MGVSAPSSELIAKEVAVTFGKFIGAMRVLTKVCSAQNGPYPNLTWNPTDIDTRAYRDGIRTVVSSPQAAHFRLRIRWFGGEGPNLLFSEIHESNRGLQVSHA